MTISCDICTNRAECMVNGYCVFAPSETVAQQDQRAACGVESSADSTKAKGPQDSPAAAHQTPRSDSIGRLLMLIVQSNNKQSRCANADLLAAQIGNLQRENAELRSELADMTEKREAASLIALKHMRTAETAERQLSEARNTLSAALFQLDEARKDSERLDWLQLWSGRFGNIDRITAVNHRFNDLPSLREAIDALKGNGND